MVGKYGSSIESKLPREIKEAAPSPKIVVGTPCIAASTAALLPKVTRLHASLNSSCSLPAPEYLKPSFFPY